MVFLFLKDIMDLELIMKIKKKYDKPSYYDILTYDSQNNWIKRERFRLNGSKISVLERRITYY